MFSYVSVDLLDPTILREDIDDLRATFQHTAEVLYWQVQTQTENLRSLFDTLNITVETLQGKIDGWKAESETEQRSLDQRIIDINNHTNTLDHVVLEHHPESYVDLGYTRHEATTSTPTVEEVSDSTPTEVAQPEVEEAPSLRLEIITPQ